MSYRRDISNEKIGRLTKLIQLANELTTLEAQCMTRQVETDRIRLKWRATTRIILRELDSFATSEKQSNVSSPE